MPIQTPICDFGLKAVPFELKSTDNRIISLNNINQMFFYMLVHEFCHNTQ